VKQFTIQKSGKFRLKMPTGFLVLKYREIEIEIRKYYEAMK